MAKDDFLLKGRTKTDPNQILYDFQLEAVDKMFSGCILNGGTGSGKSLTSLFYYLKVCGGWLDKESYKPMTICKDLYIITTAKKRNDLEWAEELSRIMMCPSVDGKDNPNGAKVIIDSWQNIKKYKDVHDSFFIFDEDKVTGKGVWVKCFLKIAKVNEWIILSATPGDTWHDYLPVFIANGFFRNRREFDEEHVVYARYVQYPKVERYYNEYRLWRLREKILIDMVFDRHTTQYHEDIYCSYDTKLYKDTIRNRWNYYENKPIEQAAGLCYLLRRIVNSDESRVVALMEILEKTPRAIIFYSFDYELDILRHLFWDVDDVEGNPLSEYEVAEYNGHLHQPIPESEKWVYLVNYSSGAEGFNCIKTDTIIFFSQTYSWRTLDQACGRIDRLITPFSDLYYYHLKSRSGIDVAIGKALREKKNFNERKFTRWDK